MVAYDNAAFNYKSNEIRYLLLNATTRRDPKKNIIGVVGVAQDLTEIKKNDRVVLSMANELRQLVDTANAPIFGIDVNGNVNKWNNKTAEIKGFSKEEAFAGIDIYRGEVWQGCTRGHRPNYELEFRTKTNEI